MRYHYHAITQFLDRLLPHYSEQRTSNKIENRIRARILVGLFFSSAIVITSCLFVFLLIHLFTDRNFSAALIILSITAIILGLQGFMFYRLGNVGTSAIIFSMTFFAVSFGAVIITGGWNSPARLLLFCSPMISFLVDGRREGFYITGLVLVVGLIMFLAQKFGWQFFQVMQGRNRNIVEVIVWVISINIMVTCLAVYDAILQDFSSRLNHIK